MTISYDIFLNFYSDPAKATKSIKDVQKQVKKTNSAVEKVELPTKRLDDAFRQMMKINTFKKMGVDASVFDSQMMDAEATVKSMGGNFNLMQQEAERMSKTFDMSSLSILFFGMAMQRFFGGLMDQMFNMFKMVDSKGIMPLNRALNRMQAAFTFLGFSILNAMSPMLIGVIDNVIQFVDWVSSLDKGWLNLLGTLVSVLAVLGGIGVVFGTLKLGLGGLGIGTQIDKALGVGTAAGLKSLAGATIMLGVGLMLLPAAADLLARGVDKITSGLESGDLGQALEGLGLAMGGLIFGGISLAMIGVSLVSIATTISNWGTAGTLTAAATTTGAKIGTAMAIGLQTGFVIAGLAAGVAALAIIEYGLMLELDKTYKGVSWGPGQNPQELVNKKIMEDTGLDTRFVPGKGYVSEIPLDFNLVPTSISDPDLFASQLENWKISGASAIDAYTESMESKETDITNSYTTTLEKPLSTAIINITDISGEGGSAMITNFADQVTATTPYLIESITVAFTSATQVMEQIVSSSVARVIADVNRALDAIRRLDAAKSASAKASSVTNNTNKTNTFNISSGSSVSSIASTVKRAVA